METRNIVNALPVNDKGLEILNAGRRYGKSVTEFCKLYIGNKKVLATKKERKLKMVENGTQMMTTFVEVFYDRGGMDDEWVGGV